MYRDEQTGIFGFHAIAEDGRSVMGIAGTATPFSTETIKDMHDWVDLGRDQFHSNAAQSMLRDAKAIVQAGIPVHISGHSLGGGVAERMSRDLSKAGLAKSIEVTTFGSSGIYATAIAKTIGEKRLSDTVDIVNFAGRRDPVPYGGGHFGETVWVESTGVDGINLAPLEAHGLDAYQASMSGDKVPDRPRPPVPPSAEKALSRPGVVRKSSYEPAQDGSTKVADGEPRSGKDGAASGFVRVVTSGIRDPDARVKGDLARILYYADAPASPDDRETGEADGLNIVHRRSGPHLGLWLEIRSARPREGGWH